MLVHWTVTEMSTRDKQTELEYHNIGTTRLVSQHFSELHLVTKSLSTENVLLTIVHHGFGSQFKPDEYGRLVVPKRCDVNSQMIRH